MGDSSPRRRRASVATMAEKPTTATDSSAMVKRNESDSTKSPAALTTRSYSIVTKPSSQCATSRS